MEIVGIFTVQNEINNKEQRYKITQNLFLFVSILAYEKNSVGYFS